MEKLCIDCQVNISHRPHPNSVRCEKCLRKRNANYERLILRKKEMKDIRQKVYVLYNYRCAVCGWQASNGRFKDKRGKTIHSNGCEIHHIIEVSAGGKDEMDNLILLCPNHHKLADLGIMTEEEVRGYQIEVPLAHKLTFIKEEYEKVFSTKRRK